MRGGNYQGVAFPTTRGIALMGQGNGLLALAVQVHHACTNRPFCVKQELIFRLYDQLRKHQRDRIDGRTGEGGKASITQTALFRVIEFSLIASCVIVDLCQGRFQVRQLAVGWIDDERTAQLPLAIARLLMPCQAKSGSSL